MALTAILGIYMKNMKVMSSILKYSPLLLCIWICSSYCHMDIPAEASVFSLHHYPVINEAGNWKEIDLMYEHILSHGRSSSKAMTECVKFYNAAGKALLRCKEHIMLLRPDSVIRHWSMEQLQAGYINLTIKEFGLTNIQAYILSIKPAVISKKCRLQLFSNLNNINYTTESSCVTGLFKRHVRNVKSYTLKNLFTGKIEAIHATSNHLFYVKNRKRFIALDKITPTDELLTLSGDKMRLHCPKGKKTHCGMTWKKFNISAVYNLEVHGKHEYFAGDNKIYVHNMYFCMNCEQESCDSRALANHQNRVHKNEDADRYRSTTPMTSEELEKYNRLWKTRITSIKQEYPFQCHYCFNAFLRIIAIPPGM